MRECDRIASIYLTQYWKMLPNTAQSSCLLPSIGFPTCLRRFRCFIDSWLFGGYSGYAEDRKAICGALSTGCIVVDREGFRSSLLEISKRL